MGIWTNADGLTITYGVDEATKAQGGDYEDHLAGDMVIDFAISNLAGLSTSADTTINYPQPLYIPSNFVLQKVDVITEVAVTGSTATLSIGVYDQTAAATINVGACVAGLAQTTIATAGTFTTLTTGSTGAGTKLGSVVYAWTSGANHQLYLTARANTAVFTAGAVRVRLYLYKSNVLESLGVDNTTPID